LQQVVVLPGEIPAHEGVQRDKVQA
jgi:hypothetical protein